MNRTLHVVALPHTALTEEYATCAYSMKILKFVKMMRAEGARVVLYGPDEIECEPDEHVVITTAEDRERWGFGGGFDTVQTPFLWDAGQPYWSEPNARAISALLARVRPQDYLCLIAGWAQQPIQAVVAPGGRGPITVEWGVGYEGICTDFCAFESYAWMHHVYGIRAGEIKGPWRNGRAYDTVIPNFFDRDDFIDPASWQGAPKADYLLYIGRLTERKGPHIAAMIAKRLGRPLLVAGPGATKVESGRIEGDGCVLEGDVHYVGSVGFAERARLMARATAVVVPTIYIEPFGGVAVEAMMSGTPVVASDWGSFTEIVTPDVGRRFRTLAQGCQAVEEASTLDPLAIRRAAEERYSLEAVGPRFTRWFDQLDGLWGIGWAA